MAKQRLLECFWYMPRLTSRMFTSHGRLFQLLKKAENLEFGQMPVLEVDGKFFSQSGAILRLLGTRLGYYAEEPYTAWRIDSTVDSVSDLANAFYKAEFGP